AGEEVALIVAPLLVGLIVAMGHPSLALCVAGGGLLAGTVWTAHSGLSRDVRHPEAAPAGRGHVPAVIWLAIASLVGPGAALGALFVTLYLLIDQLAPAGTGTRTFAWVVTANNGGLAFGAVAGGAAIAAATGATGLWLAALCALLGAVPAAAARAKS